MVWFRRYRGDIKLFLIDKKFNIKKSHQNISGGIFGGEPIDFDLFLTFYNN